jgi:formylglycine-generating enzyme required for sulfatase activity
MSAELRRMLKFVIPSLLLVILIVAGVRFFRHPGPIRLSPPWPGLVGESPGETRINPNDGLKYVWIPPGTFAMGCSAPDKDCNVSEMPPHQVIITKGFWIGQTAVTVGAYKRFAWAEGRPMPPQVPGTPINPGWRNDNMPIEAVLWVDAEAYCSWAGGRLPTEAEWEYAARGGTTGARYGPVDEIAWYADNSGKKRLDSTRIWEENQKYWDRPGYKNYNQQLYYDNSNSVHEVGLKRPNSFGLFDMLGNVWEWVNDWYDDHYYATSPIQDPAGPASGENRVMRGGSWYTKPEFVRVSERGADYPLHRADDRGFRCAGRLRDR